MTTSHTPYLSLPALVLVPPAFYPAVYYAANTPLPVFVFQGLRDPNKDPLLRSPYLRPWFDKKQTMCPQACAVACYRCHYCTHVSLNDGQDCLLQAVLMWSLQVKPSSIYISKYLFIGLLRMISPSIFIAGSRIRLSFIKAHWVFPVAIRNLLLLHQFESDSMISVAFCSSCNLE